MLMKLLRNQMKAVPVTRSGQRAGGAIGLRPSTGARRLPPTAARQSTTRSSSTVQRWSPLDPLRPRPSRVLASLQRAHFSTRASAESDAERQAATSAFRLEGQSAIITGAARGLGYACAKQMALAGAKVLLADVDAEELEKATAQLQRDGFTAVSCVCDVGDKKAVENMVATAARELGSVDIMVSNAGIVKKADFLDMTEEDFDAVIRVNLKGVFLTGQAAGKEMVKQGRGGSIINMSSVNGMCAIPSIAGYNASKGGVTNLTKTMALSLIPHGIRVNAVGPGSIMTDVLKEVVLQDPEVCRGALSRTPMGRFGDPDEIGRIAVFLASDASSYMTGECVYADGGRRAMNYTVPVTDEQIEALQADS